MISLEGTLGNKTPHFEMQNGDIPSAVHIGFLIPILQNNALWGASCVATLISPFCMQFGS
jgi:hypothetical protein